MLQPNVFWSYNSIIFLKKQNKDQSLQYLPKTNENDDHEVDYM